MNLQERFEVQEAVQQWTASFMQQYNISAAVMEDALTKVILRLKDQVVIDLLVAAAQAQSAQKQSVVQEQAPQNGEKYDGDTINESD